MGKETNSVGSLMNTIMYSVEEKVYGESGAASRYLGDRRGQCTYLSALVAEMARTQGLQAERKDLGTFFLDEGGHDITIIEGILGVDLSFCQLNNYPLFQAKNPFEEAILLTGIFTLTQDTILNYWRIFSPETLETATPKRVTAIIDTLLTTGSSPELDRMVIQSNELLYNDTYRKLRRERYGKS